jgi:hypothetical protein
MDRPLLLLRRRPSKSLSCLFFIPGWFVPLRSAVYQGSPQDTVLFRTTVLALRETGLVWAFGCVSQTHKKAGSQVHRDKSPETRRYAMDCGTWLQESYCLRSVLARRGWVVYVAYIQTARGDESTLGHTGPHDATCGCGWQELRLERSAVKIWGYGFHQVIQKVQDG